MAKFFFIILVFYFVFIPASCTTETGTKTEKKVPLSGSELEAETKIADAIIRSAIKSAGLNGFDNAKAAFRFREKQYTCQNNSGAFKYERKFMSEDGKKIIDVLTNDGFIRLTDGDTTMLENKKAKAFGNSVNSVIYFAFLPFRLTDDAVESRYLSKTEIKGNAYHKIQISFQKAGGGDDFEDVFIYWFDVKTFRMDYLAYEYQTDGGGMRFREAFNSRTVNGVNIQDYKNYKPKEKGSVPLDQIDAAFQNDELELLSEIVLENVVIEKF
jgi:hypothetical protein